MAEEAADKPARRDWVQEAYQTFVANVDVLDPTDPVKAVGDFFERNASAELKARAKAEGRTPAKCWKFVEAVARKALKGRSGHVDPSAVYAIVMHWYDDVPVDWDRKPTETDAEFKKAEANGSRSDDPKDAGAAPEPKKEEPAAAKPKPKPKPKRMPKDRQTFFFDILSGDNGASVG